jgi:hypothetical protein
MGRVPPPAVCLAFLSLVACSTQWYASPCGNGDPEGVQCLDEADTLWEEPSLELCSEIEATDGSPCTELQASCVHSQAFTCVSMDPAMRSSEAFLTCRNTPPEEGVCPTSSRTAKRNIEYVATAERQILAKEVLDVRLARYHYRDANKPGLKLGYILEDHPSASFSGDGRVDLYAYMSAVVALAQQQQSEIDALKAEVSALKATR